MSIEADYVWMDGSFIPFNEATVPLMTHTLHYGYGAFEGIRAYQRSDGTSHVFRIREHIERLFESASILGIAIPYPLEEIEQVCFEVLKKNKFETGYLRPLVYLGSETMGLGAFTNTVHVAIASWKWGAYLGDEGLKNGIRCKISSFNRSHVNVNMVKGKICGQYVNSVISKREALNGGYQEAIMLDTQGYVSECTGENLFMVKKGNIYTAPYGSSILGGITRDSLIKIARDLGYTLTERLFTRDELYVADEIFLCGTAAEVTPVKEVDDRMIGKGEPGLMTRAIASRFFDIVKGSHPDHPEWRYGYSLDL
jgi:branched-chain amino acid aminotransferase